tara:strand:- start:886 stop:1338 length:453 start_codon:yes stop_codon:yes gene_type:complete
MKKIIATLLTFIIFTSCGYTPIYSNKNFDFKLKNIISSKDNQLNSNVEKKLLVFSNQESQKIISLKIDVQRKINILTKDSKGDPSRYEMIIDIKLETTYGQNQNVIRSFQEKFNYNTNSNRFELNQYEKEVENLLINKNIDRIIAYLSKV